MSNKSERVALFAIGVFGRKLIGFVVAAAGFCGDWWSLLVNPFVASRGSASVETDS